MELDPGELELEPDGNHLVDGQERSQIRKDIRIQLKPKLASDKNKRSSRLKKTIRIKRNNHLDNTLISKKSGHSSETKLLWNHTEKLIGDPSTIPNAHLCPICMKPILTYGRLVLF
ncbi:hypothetical protein LOD99_14395 [Oopsacas minuta]|uniref:Uncharacterized protein n=1 Tax=Oopsacas minuta TaxID=111878 RepID=A0AAV7KHI6_9METZ|nr:hypothetical protein LOD99_14395 [Oopsacas minuta]